MASLSNNIEPYCRSIGLEDKSLPLGSVGYEGMYRGREIAVVCGRRSKTNYAGEVRFRTYDGHRLSITGRTSLKTRLVLSDASRGGALAEFINKRLGSEKVESVAPALAHLVVWASEPEWVRNMIQDQESYNMLSYLLPSQGPQVNASFTLGPEAFEFHLNSRAFSPEQVGYWIDAVLRLLEALESRPAPLKVAELTKTEVMIKDNPWMVIGLLSGSFILLGLLLSAAMIAGILLFAWLGN